MSIASELQNYADGLDDAYDAVSDMSGIIPQDKNMNNLDAAIRTIPVGTTPNDGVLTIQQNGSTLGTFSANQSANTTVNITGGATKLNLSWTGSDMWDVDTQASVTGTTVWNGMTNGTVEVTDISAANEPSGVITSSAMLSTWHDEIYGDLTDVTYFSTVFTVRGNTTKSITYLYSTAHGWLYPVTYNIQKELTAGTNIAIAADGTISATDTTYSDFTGATSSVAGAHGLVPAPTTSDPDKYLKGDGTWSTVNAKLVEMSYGESNAWTKFINAYNAGSIVYCRASSNANPGSGSQTRKAFMAYVNNATTPTSVEFQYVRSVSSKSASQPVDQVFVYTLTNSNGGTWSVASRDMAPKLAAGTNTTVNYSSGTYTISATDTTYSNMTGATSGTAGAAGLVPAPAAGDESKFLQGDGTWATVSGGGGATLSMQDWNDLFAVNIPTVDFTVVLSAGQGSIGPTGDADYEISGATPNTPYELTITRDPLNSTDPLTAFAVMYSGGPTAPYIDNIVASGNTITFDTLQAVGYWPTEYIILAIECGNVSKTVKIAPN